MTKRLLLTRPDHDYATRYLSAWAEKFFDLAKKNDYSIVDLRRERANRKGKESVLRARQEFLRNIQKLLTSKTTTDDSSSLRYLVWDMKHLALCGKADKKL